MSGARRRKADSQDTALRAEVIATARAMSRSGLSPGRSGNVSARVPGGMLITPTGMAYEALTPEDVVRVGEDGSVAANQRKPSSEWRFHLAAYATRSDRAAVVHTHSLNATALACAHKPIPAFHYMVAIAGGDDIPLVPYATFGTEELSRHVASGLANRDACLMANHGQIALGRSLAGALEMAQEVETLAAQYVTVLQLGKPVILPTTEMRLMLEKFRAYGQHAQEDGGAKS
ncbi:MAG: class II aldolase/adducin family protein [Hyphomicrobiaceae bacterium]